MHTVFDWQIDLILRLRELLPGLVGVFEVFTFLGNELFFLMLLPFVYWAIDRRTGARLTVLVLISTYINAAVKFLVGWPRPFVYAPERLGPLFALPMAETIDRYGATGFGFPSNHTQGAVVTWGFLAVALMLEARRDAPAAGGAPPGQRSEIAESGAPALGLLRPVFLALCGLLIVLVPLSRVYLAVHFPHDLLGGYLLGTALLAVFLWLGPPVEQWLAHASLGAQLAVAAAVPAVVQLAYPGEDAVTAGATLLGMGLGFIAERRHIRFRTAGPVVQRAVRFAVGIVGMVALYAGLKAAFATLEPALVWRFVRYTLMGLWGGVGAPWLFTQVGLAGRTEGR